MKKVLKFLFLVTGILSVSVAIAMALNSVVVCISNETMTSDIYKDRKIIEKDFYKSSSFDGNIISSLARELQNSVKNNEGGSSEKNKKEIEKQKESSKEYIKNNYKNAKVIVINNETKEIYSNTEYKTIEDFKKNISGYCDIEVNGGPQERHTYKKTLNGKEYSGYNNRIYSYEENPTDYTAYISIPKSLVQDNTDTIYNKYENYIGALNYIQGNIPTYIVCLVSLIISVFAYKKIDEDVFGKEGVFFRLYNLIPLELILFGIFLFLVFGVSIGEQVTWTETPIYIMLGFSAILFLGFSILYILFKQFKYFNYSIKVLSTSWIIKLLLILKNIINRTSKNVKDTKLRLMPFSKRLIFISVGLVAFCAILILLGLMTGGFLVFVSILLAPIGFAAIIYYIIKSLDYLMDIMEGTERITNGDINHKIEIKGDDNFTDLAKNINNIGQGLDRAIDNQLRSERMKSELITNVSHDLKTPLTSIINYIELIKKEDDIKPEHIRDYVGVLDKKSTRLKALIEDLFEASKASSGNIDLNMEKIDIKQLLRQSIGEMEEKLSEANLDIRLNTPEDKVYINADGRRMYRVLENVLGNISKYSLNNTRVYIDLVNEDNKVSLTMKNISSYELNFDPIEIMERFKRADESRNTEGSGLGLAISRDLVRLQGGKFDINIDGDLFKVSIEFVGVSK